MSRVIVPLAFILAAAIVLATVAPVLASGVGFTPGRLQFNDSAGGLEATLYIINTGQETSHYRVYPEKPYASWFKISPSEFSLEPSQNLAVKVTVLRSNIGPGEYGAQICVVAFADRLNARIGTGAKVPVHISLSALSPAGTGINPSPESAITVSPPTPSNAPETKAAAGDQASPGSPVRIRLWMGIITIALASIVTVILFMRRRKRFEA